KVRRDSPRRVRKTRAELGAGRVPIQARDQDLIEIDVWLHASRHPERVGEPHSGGEADFPFLPDIAADCDICASAVGNAEDGDAVAWLERKSWWYALDHLVRTKVEHHPFSPALDSRRGRDNPVDLNPPKLRPRLESAGRGDQIAQSLPGHQLVNRRA